MTGLLEALLKDVDFLSPPASVPDDVPLELHASYSARETLAAFGYEQAANFRGGVMYLKDRHADLFFRHDRQGGATLCAKPPLRRLRHERDPLSLADAVDDPFGEC